MRFNVQMLGEWRPLLLCVARKHTWTWSLFIFATSSFLCTVTLAVTVGFNPAHRHLQPCLQPHMLSSPLKLNMHMACAGDVLASQGLPWRVSVHPAFSATSGMRAARLRCCACPLPSGSARFTDGPQGAPWLPVLLLAPARQDWRTLGGSCWPH